jgi:hypothetical protein
VHVNKELVEVPIGTLALSLTVLDEPANPYVPDVGVGVGDGIGVGAGIMVASASNRVGII